MPSIVPDLLAALAAALPFAVGAALAAAIALAGARRAGGTAGRAAPPLGPAPGAAFLFEGERLLDANAAGWDMIARAGGATSLPAVTALAGRAHPGLPAALAGAAAEGEAPRREGGAPPARFAREGARLRLEVPVQGGGAALAAGTAPGEAGVVVDAAIFAAMEEELAALRAAMDAIPVPVWRAGTEGEPFWANAAYLARAGGDPAAWPPPPLFDEPELADLPPPNSPRRMRAAASGGWFDVSRPIEDAALRCAVPADEAAEAEASLRGFAMALTDTFAHLPIGLAVFDGGGRLKLFNPALADLTEIPAGTLVARPSLRDLLDRMRETRLLAEPGDWHDWSGRIARMESDSRSGTYMETWDIEGGRNWRVSGRPHPGGAIALLIEDISSEVLLARRFRAQIETARAIADAIPEAIAVFGREGVLVSSNAAYAELWGVDPSTTLVDVTIAEACRTWMARAAPSRVWGELRDAVTGGPGGGRARTEWSASIETAGGGRLRCRCVPLAGGATLIGFDGALGERRQRAPAAPAPELRVAAE